MTEQQTAGQSAQLPEIDKAPEKAPVQRPIVKPLLNQSLSLEQHSNNSWLLSVPAGTDPDDFHLNSTPFEIIADRLRRFDTVKLVEAGGAWWAEAIVVFASPQKVLCHILRHVSLEVNSEDQTDVPKGFDVRPALPSDGQSGWAVVRRIDGVLMNAGVTLPRRADAVWFISGHNAA